MKTRDALLLVSVWGCAAAPRMRENVLELRCDPSDARVFVDSIERGACADFGSRALELGKGMHSIEVKKQSMAPYQTFIDPSGTTARLRVSLPSRLDSSGVNP